MADLQSAALPLGEGAFKYREYLSEHSLWGQSLLERRTPHARLPSAYAQADQKVIPPNRYKLPDKTPCFTAERSGRKCKRDRQFGPPTPTISHRGETLL